MMSSYIQDLIFKMYVSLSMKYQADPESSTKGLAKEHALNLPGLKKSMPGRGRAYRVKLFPQGGQVTQDIYSVQFLFLSNWCANTRIETSKEGGIGFKQGRNTWLE